MSESNRGAAKSAPDTVGPYRIVNRLGGGGMGEVYRARDERLERWVAIKHIRPEEADARSRERLRREARAVASLSHPSIVQVHDIVESDEGDWIVMELVEGMTLQEMIDADRLDVDQIVHLAKEIAEGLAEAHAKGIIHRDLKTENVMVTKSSHAKILDFGLAKRIWHGRHEASLSVQGAILGTGRAMSPEQVLGEEVDHRSDLFSFGTLLFETVTGRRPFVGSSLIITLAQVCTEEQPSAREVNPEVPRELSELIDNLLEKDPLQRPQSAGEVVEALQRITGRIASRTLTDHDPSDTAVALALPPEPPPTTPSTPPLPLSMARSSSSRVTGVRPAESTAGIFIKTLVQTSLISGAELGDRFGDARAYEIFSRLDRLTRDVLAEHEGLEIHKTDDGFLFLFERPVDALEFVLSYHQRISDFSAEVGVPIETRAAIHLSEVFLRENPQEEISRGAKPLEVEGLAKLIVARVMSLAGEGQILMTQEAYDMARRALVGHRLSQQQLYWNSHGRFLFNGVDEVVRLFQVSSEPLVNATLCETAEAQRVESDEAASPTRWPRRRGLMVAAAVVLAVAVGAVFKLSDLLAPNPQPVDVGLVDDSNVRKSLAVLGFRNLTDNPEHAWLATALSELLTTDLSAGDDLRLIDGESVARIKSSKTITVGETLAQDTLDNIRTSLGADYVVVGSYLYYNETRKLTVQMKVQETERGDIFSFSDTGGESELLQLVSSVGDDIRGKLGLKTPESGKEKKTRAGLPSNHEARRLYFEAIQKLRSFDALTARDLLQQALLIDNEAALVHAALSETWLALGHDQEAQTSASLAFKYAEGLRMVDYLQIEASDHEASERWGEAIETHRVLLGYYPDDINYGLRLAKAEIGAKLYHDALATVAGLRLLPTREDPRLDLTEAWAAVEAQRNQEALAAAQRAVEKGKALGNLVLVAEANRLQGRAYYNLGKFDEAETQLEEARRLFTETGDQGGVGNTLLNFSFSANLRRDHDGAEQYLRQALVMYEKTGSRKKLARVKNGLASSLAEKGELRKARDMVTEALEDVRLVGLHHREINYLDTLVWILVQIGELREANKLGQESIDLSIEHKDKRMEAWAYYNLAQVAFLSGKLPRAEAMLHKMLQLAQEIENHQLTALAYNVQGAVHLAKGEVVKARELFSTYWDLQSSRESGEQPTTEHHFALTLLEIGRLEEAASMAKLIANRFRNAHRADYQAAAMAVESEALWALGKEDEARRTLREALDLRRTSEVASVRLRLALTEARFMAEEDLEKATDLMRTVSREARRLEYNGIKLQAMLYLGTMEARYSDDQATFGTGIKRLHAVAGEAQELGYGLIARHATDEIVRLNDSRAEANTALGPL